MSKASLEPGTSKGKGKKDGGKGGEGNPQTMALNDTKAGMQGLDTEKINKIIYEASKNSPYYRNQQERQGKIDRQIELLVAKISDLTQYERKEAKKDMDAMALELDAQRRDLSRIIVHVDMDMFYAAVEARDNPSLAKIPMAVGSWSMLSTSNYLARKFGVRAGMAGFIGKKLCPQLKIVPINFKKYIPASEQVMEVIKEYDADYSAASLDEAYLDITDFVKNRFVAGGGLHEVKGSSSQHGDDPFTILLPKEMWDMANKVVEELRAKVFEKTKLTCSAGIAHNKMFAKVCSDINKPNNQFMLKATSLDAVKEFVDKTPVRKIGGVGPMQDQKLKALDIVTCADLYEKRDLINLLFYPSSIDFYLRIYLGIGSNRVLSEDGHRKSKSAETTFKATDDMNILNNYLDNLSQEVADDIKKEGLKGRTITVKIKWATFKVNDKSKSIKFFSDDAATIGNVAKELLTKSMSEKKKGKSETRIRLIGVRVSNFEGEKEDPEEEKRENELAKENEKKRPRQQSIDEFVKKMKPGVVFVTARQMKDLCEDESDGEDIYDESFVCSECRTDFTTLELLETHMEVDNCDAAADELHGQKDEPKVVDRIPLSNVTSAGLEEAREETFTCPVCHSSKSDLRALNEHLDLCLNT